MSAKTSSRIDGLIDLVRTSEPLDRGRALRRLHILNENNKLTDTKRVALEEAIWASRDEDGWPRDSQVHPWIYLDLPGHEHAQPVFIRRIVKAVANGNVGEFSLLNLRAGLGRLEMPVDFD